MEPLSLIETAEAVQGSLYPEDQGDSILREISTDSRNLDAGALFVPLRGENFDGHNFIEKAKEKGAVAYLTEGEPVAGTGAAFVSVRVKSTLRSLMHLANHYRNRYSSVVVGITGSNGKTTTKDLLGLVLSKAGPTVYSERSFNNFVGLPLTLFRMNGTTQYTVLEMGTNSPGEIASLTSLAGPEIGIITNISESHLEGLGDRDGIAREKSALLHGLIGRRLSILNRDDVYYETLAKAAHDRVVTYGICHRADYTAIHVEVSLEGVAFEVGGVKLRLPLLGVHNIYNALAVFACASELGIPSEHIAGAFECFEGPPMRLKPVKKGNLLVINDAYNANPGSMESALKTFSVLPTPGRKVVVLGDMLELADRSQELHRKIGRQLSCGQFGLVVAVGPKAQGYLEGAKESGIPHGRMVAFRDTKEALGTFTELLKRDDAILIKGSRKMGLERLVEAVLAMDI